MLETVVTSDEDVGVSVFSVISFEMLMTYAISFPPWS